MNIFLYFIVSYKIHSNKEEWPCCDICVIILCFIYVHNAISDAHIRYNLRLHHIFNEYTDLILEITQCNYSKTSLSLPLITQEQPTGTSLVGTFISSWDQVCKIVRYLLNYYFSTAFSFWHWKRQIDHFLIKKIR